MTVDLMGVPGSQRVGKFHRQLRNVLLLLRRKRSHPFSSQPENAVRAFLLPFGNIVTQQVLLSCQPRLQRLFELCHLGIVHLPDEFSSIACETGEQIRPEQIVLDERPVEIVIRQPVRRPVAGLPDDRFIPRQRFLAVSRQNAAQARGNKRLLGTIQAEIAVDLTGDEPVRMIVQQRRGGAAGKRERREQQYGEQDASCAGDVHGSECLTNEAEA